ncbi:MarR family winged helix-turn-helix transcriptional regulator [Neptunicoccus cionae]|uniref:MarR family transcriptional regulator n=1 Tax=Neptunicoccus cionae TaxID=2035344 RepID=A0A916R1N5_9RHOB|nr:MarR family transcriptional regulator [Amylibacter cionae]GGA25131.1 MarR family transcriptional regulator [Amylibacter cionae]
MKQSIDSDNFSFLLLDVARLLRADFERRVAGAELGITPGEARTLANVARFGPLRQHDLANLTGIGPMSVTGMIDNLEQAGLVIRTPDPDDRRAKQVQITQKAHALLEDLHRIGEDVRAISRGGLSTEEWDTFHRLLKSARDNHLSAHHSRRISGKAET